MAANIGQYHVPAASFCATELSGFSLGKNASKPIEASRAMGEITYQGESPYLMPPALDATAHVSGSGVRMIVYASVHGKPPDAFEIQIPLTRDQARRLARELAASADPPKRR